MSQDMALFVLQRTQYSFVNFQSLITIMDELQVCFAEQ